MHECRMLRFLKHFWRSLLAVGAVVGLIYLPADIVGIPTVVQPLNVALSSISREWLLIGFAGVVSIYIVWMDARPLLRLWLSKRKKPLIHVEGVKHSIEVDRIEIKEPNKPPQGKFRRIYMLPVRNNSERTLRRVQLAFAETGPYGRLPLIGDEQQVETDLHPGEVANFRLGETDLGVGSTLNLLDGNDERYARWASFQSDTIGGHAFVAASRGLGTMRYRIPLTLSAEDLRSEQVDLIVALDCQNAKVTVEPATPDHPVVLDLKPAPERRPQ